MTVPATRPPARQAEADLLVLARFEDFTGWLFDRTAKWPKSARFTLTQRIENHALDVVEDLVIARYRRQGRKERLESVNLRLERLRHLLRLARGANVCPFKVFESAMRALDETGRMVHGWRTSRPERETDRRTPTTTRNPPPVPDTNQRTLSAGVVVRGGADRGPAAAPAVHSWCATRSISRAHVGCGVAGTRVGGRACDRGPVRRCERTTRANARTVTVLSPISRSVKRSGTG